MFNIYALLKDAILLNNYYNMNTPKSTHWSLDSKSGNDEVSGIFKSIVARVLAQGPKNTDDVLKIANDLGYQFTRADATVVRHLNNVR